MAFLVGPTLQLPWSSAEEDDRRFWRILGILLVPLLVIAVAIPFIKVPEPEREELERLPPQLARIVMEKKEIPKPPPPKPKEEEKPEPKEEKPEPKKEEKKPEPKPEPKPEKKSDPEPVKIQQAKERAKKSGVLAMQDELSAMRESFDTSDVKKPTRNISTANAEAEKVDRNLISSGAKAKSGGVDVAALSRDTGGVALSGKETTAVDSKLEEATQAAEQAREVAKRDKTYRGDQAIRQKMEEAKSRIFAIYNRALRKNPTLQGTVMFKIVIEPDGSVSDAEIVSSELNDEDLERKLLAAVRFIDFGASNVLQTTLNYSFDFLPY